MGFVVAVKKFSLAWLACAVLWGSREAYAAVQVFSEQPLQYALISAQLPTQDMKNIVNGALNLLTSYPPPSRQIRLQYEDYKVENFHNYDFIVELSTAQNIERELNMLERMGGFALSGGPVGTMVTSPQMAGPFLIYVSQDDFLQAESGSAVGGAVAKLATALAQEIFGHVLSLKNRARSFPVGLSPQRRQELYLGVPEVQVMQQTALREAIEFTQRVLNGGNVFLTDNDKKSFAESSQNMADRLAKRIEYVDSLKPSPNVIAVDFKSKCRTLLSP